MKKKTRKWKYKDESESEQESRENSLQPKREHMQSHAIVPKKKGKKKRGGLRLVRLNRMGYDFE